MPMCNMWKEQQCRSLWDKNKRFGKDAPQMCPTVEDPTGTVASYAPHLVKYYKTLATPMGPIQIPVTDDDRNSAEFMPTGEHLKLVELSGMIGPQVTPRYKYWN